MRPAPLGYLRTGVELGAIIAAVGAMMLPRGEGLGRDLREAKHQ